MNTIQTAFTRWIARSPNRVTFDGDGTCYYGEGMMNEITAAQMEGIERRGFIAWSNRNQTYVITRAGHEMLRAA